MIIIEQNDGQLISKRLIDFTTMQLIQLVQLENEKIVGALTESSIIIWSLHINQLHIEYIEHNIHKQKINSICYGFSEVRNYTDGYGIEYLLFYNA